MLSLDADPVVGALDPERVNDGRAVPEWRVLGRLEKTAIGARGGHGVTTVRRREPAGCLLYGPYWQLPAGTYRLNFRCRSGKPRISGQPVLGVEVVAVADACLRRLVRPCEHPHAFLIWSWDYPDDE